MPDGTPLEIEMNTLGSADYRELDEIVKRNMDAVRLKIAFKIGKFPEQLKAARAGKFQVWQVGLSAASPDSSVVFQLAYSQQVGQQNFSRFRNKQLDDLFQRQGTMADSPERDALLREAARIWITYMPYKIRVHRIGTDLWQPWVMGYKRHPFSQSFWRYIDIDTDRQQKK
jgi:ABC-type transport system substrate-binding protein